MTFWYVHLVNSASKVTRVCVHLWCFCNVSFSYRSAIWPHTRSSSSRMKTAMAYGSLGTYGHQVELRLRGLLCLWLACTNRLRSAPTYHRYSTSLYSVHEIHAELYWTQCARWITELNYGSATFASNETQWVIEEIRH